MATPGDGIHETSSIYNAASLIAGGATYLGPRLAPGGWVAFRFADARGEVKVEERRIKLRCATPVQPQDLIAALSALRDEIRTVKAEAGVWEDRSRAVR